MKTGSQLIGEATAQALMLALRIRDTQFRRATPPRMHKHIHDRHDGPDGKNPTIHMLVRSCNSGFNHKPDERALRPHGRQSERGWQCSPKRPSFARREAPAT